MKRIINFMYSTEGQPILYVKACRKRKSLTEYTGIAGDYFEYWDWDVFPICKRIYSKLTSIEEKLNPEGVFPVEKREVMMILLVSTFDYLKKSSDTTDFFNKTIAHHN